MQKGKKIRLEDVQWGFREERVTDPRDGRTGLTDLREQ